MDKRKDIPFVPKGELMTDELPIITEAEPTMDDCLLLNGRNHGKMKAISKPKKGTKRAKEKIRRDKIESKFLKNEPSIAGYGATDRSKPTRRNRG